MQLSKINTLRPLPYPYKPYPWNWERKSRNQETFVRSLFRKKWKSDNAKSQHQIQNWDGCLKSSLKIELGNFLSKVKI